MGVGVGGGIGSSIGSIGLLVVVVVVGLCMGSLPLSSSSSESSRRLAPCAVCKVLVSSFDKGIERTAKGHYTGGDAAWEEDNKKTYKHSELRLTEIQEALCSEVSLGKDHCHEFAVNHEDMLEQWWEESYRNAGEDLMSWLCIKKLSLCCPDNHFGPECKPCPGSPDNICSGHGRCKGNGTRTGSGECSCKTGYNGELCDRCAPLFYQTNNDGDPIACSACHKACKNGCKGPGAKNCESCKDGWEFNKDQECVDSNECLSETRLCRTSEFCQNIEGSFNCLACDTACDGCFADGPDGCIRCADGYSMKNKLCIDNSTVERQNQMSFTRYLIYCGIAIASLIVFQKNAVLASGIGLAIGVYIATTEYLLTNR